MFGNENIEGDCCLNLRRRNVYYPDDEGCKCLRIASNYLRDCTVSYPHIATILKFSYLFTFYVTNLNCVLVGLYAIQQGCTNPGRQAPLPTELRVCTVAPSTCGLSVCNWLHFSILAPRIWRWLLHFWQSCACLPYIVYMLFI